MPAEAALAPAPRRPARTIAASGRIHFWQSGSLWIGRGEGRSERHDHHAHQLALALEGSFRFRDQPLDGWTEFTAAIVPSHAPHEFELDETAVAHLFVEPESAEGRALSKRFAGGGIAALPPAAAREWSERLLAAWRANADADTMLRVARGAVAAFAGTAFAARAADAAAASRTAGAAAAAAVDAAAGGTDAAARDAAAAGAVADSDIARDTQTIDPRVARALQYIRSRVRAPVSLDDAAAAAALSPSRFRHLFIAETGTTFRAYLLWLRINVAIEAAMSGATWTEAAHEAGFADSSHLTRTHRRMFGIEPTAIRCE